MWKKKSDKKHTSSILKSRCLLQHDLKSDKKNEILCRLKYFHEWVYQFVECEKMRPFAIIYLKETDMQIYTIYTHASAIANHFLYGFFLLLADEAIPLQFTMWLDG